MKKIYLLCEPKHANLGDQAQLMCTLRWITENYPEHKIVKLGYMFGVFDFDIKSRIKSLMPILKYFYLKLTVKKEDIFIGHSGYFFVDHHIGWATFAFFMKYFPNNKMIILPQTINFYSPVAKQIAVKAFGSKRNLTLLCRDEVSFNKAKQLFGNTRMLLYPDIVTSLIGTMRFDSDRNGILLCRRNDIESFYSKEEMDTFLNRFGNIRKEITDTTINISPKEMAQNRDKLILEKIRYFSTFKVVVTDRYHGTIFSAIASTPVIVINSADHKLSSGVNWFDKKIFGSAVQFAENLDDAYNMADQILKNNLTIDMPPYFKVKYWDVLKTYFNLP